MALQQNIFPCEDIFKSLREHKKPFSFYTSLDSLKLSPVSGKNKWTSFHFLMIIRKHFQSGCNGCNTRNFFLEYLHCMFKGRSILSCPQIILK